MESRRLAGNDPEKAGAFSFLRHLPQEWRERRVLGLVEDLGRQMGRDPMAALGRLDALAQTLPDDPSAHAGWSMSVCAWVERWASAEPIIARRLLDDLADHAARHPGESALKAHWAVAILHFVAARAGADPEGCRVLLATLEPHLLAPGAPLALRRLWAMAGQRWIIALSGSNGQAALAGLGAVASLALRIAPEIPTDLSIVSLWLETVMGMMTPENLQEAWVRGAIFQQAQALEAAYYRHGTIAAALSGLQLILREDPPA